MLTSARHSADVRPLLVPQSQPARLATDGHSLQTLSSVYMYQHTLSKTCMSLILCGFSRGKVWVSSSIDLHAWLRPGLQRGNVFGLKQGFMHKLPPSRLLEKTILFLFLGVFVLLTLLLTADVFAGPKNTTILLATHWSSDVMVSGALVSKTSMLAQTRTCGSQCIGCKQHPCWSHGVRVHAEKLSSHITVVSSADQYRFNTILIRRPKTVRRMRLYCKLQHEVLLHAKSCNLAGRRTPPPQPSVLPSSSSSASRRRRRHRFVVLLLLLVLGVGSRRRGRCPCRLRRRCLFLAVVVLGMSVVVIVLLLLILFLLILIVLCVDVGVIVDAVAVAVFIVLLLLLLRLILLLLLLLLLLVGVVLVIVVVSGGGFGRSSSSSSSSWTLLLLLLLKLWLLLLLLLLLLLWLLLLLLSSSPSSPSSRSSLLLLLPPPWLRPRPWLFLLMVLIFLDRSPRETHMQWSEQAASYKL